LSQPVQLAVASGSDDLIPTLLEKMREIRPDLPLYLLSEFKIEGPVWIPYHPGRTVSQNLALCRSLLQGKRIQHAGLILQPRMPYWKLRLTGFLLGKLNTIFFNENLDHYMLRPRSAGAIARHLFWRMKNLIRWELRPGGGTYTLLWRLRHPKAFLRPLHALLARLIPNLAPRGSWAPAPIECEELLEGISVVIPSRDGNDLLARLLPGLRRELEGIPNEIIVVDNGSNQPARFDGVNVIVEPKPLPFARAVNIGIRETRYSHVMLLNNDMILEQGFFPPLRDAFDTVPDLFAATAQIFHPPGERREETGKAVLPARRKVDEFPITCELPIQGEDLSHVLYGSGGCTLYDARKLKHLGGMREIYEPAYVEDLDLGYRGWQQGWPTVFVSGAKLEHRHRATTSRYFSPAQLDEALETNYLLFLTRTISSERVFRLLWTRAIDRLNHRAALMTPDKAAEHALARAWRMCRNLRSCPFDEEKILAIAGGDVAVFPGQRPGGKPVILIASPYIPFPLSHGGAVRMFNLMRRAAHDFDQVLVCFVDELHSPPREVLDSCVEVVTVRRQGSHQRPLTSRPGVVEEFDSKAFHATVELALRKWKPAIAQLEFTQMAQYAADCFPAKTILVEHDVTLDLYAQLLERGEDWETRQQYSRWVSFEQSTWRQVDAIVAMSDKDRASIHSTKAVTIPNGVDLARFTPSGSRPEPGRILFIGSFAHLPNVLAVDFFLREAWPRIQAEIKATVHIIAGARHRYFLERYRDRVDPPLDQPGLEIEDFVSDPRPAYDRATAVVAPLLASAGTNIKIMEAMAMGKAVVSTSSGINGLHGLENGHDLLIADSGEEFARAVVDILRDAERRDSIGRNARATVERLYGWDAIAGLQKEFYESLLPRTE
jgi:glycosyltransferase involved in cell wall biosynthesis/GT2 family glycosyltransferase